MSRNNACYRSGCGDRPHVGFAKLRTVNDLKFSESVYGLGAGIFFIAPGLIAG